MEYKERQGQSKQYELLMKMWQDKEQQTTIRWKILKELHEPAPDCCLKDEPYFYHDGLWDIFPDTCEYTQYLQENGNEGDETELVVDIWCLVIAETGNPDYLPHLAHFHKVNIEGY